MRSSHSAPDKALYVGRRSATTAATLLRTFLDGELTDEHVAERNVHRPREGRPYIRVLGARTYLTQDAPPVVERHARTVENPGAPRARIREAAAEGRTVRVVGLF